MQLKTTLQNGRDKKKIRVRNPDFRAAMLFMAPSLAGISLFFIFPFADTIKRSFFDTAGVNFVFFENYSSAMRNESFRLSAYNTARFIAVCIPLLLVVSLLLALLSNFIGKRAGGFKMVFLLSMAVPVASIVLLWQLLFHDNGLVNTVLMAAGADKISFMYSDAAFWVLVGTYIWKNMGYDMILWLAGLDGINKALYEAAYVDGAGAVRCFRYITLPSLLPTVGLVTVISLLNSFKVFREAYLVGGAYPHDSIYLLQHLFNNWFLNMDISRLCAAAVMLCAVLLTVIILLQRFLRGEDD